MMKTGARLLGPRFSCAGRKQSAQENTCPIVNSRVSAFAWARHIEKMDPFGIKPGNDGLEGLVVGTLKIHQHQGAAGCPGRPGSQKAPASKDGQINDQGPV